MLNEMNEIELVEPETKQGKLSRNRWTVLIVDKDDEVHRATKQALCSTEFQGRELDFFSAYSAQEATEWLEKDGQDVAVVLLDVALEAHDSGLKLVEQIRHDFRNHCVRIILQTGQAAQASVRDIVVEYKINGYLVKSELTDEKLFATVVTALRAYDDLTSLQALACKSAESADSQKSVEPTLKQQQAYLRQVIDINPHFIFAKDREGRFTLANKAFADAYDTTVEDIIGKTDADFNPHTALVERYNQDDLSVVRTGQALFIEEEQVTNIKGQRLWRKTVKRPILDENGTPYQVLGVATDITKLKSVELALRESEERLRSFLEALPDITFIMDETGRYAEVLATESNPLYQGAVEQLKGKKLHQVLPQDKADLFLEVIRTTLETNEAQIVEYELDTLVGKAWFEGRTSPIRSRSEEPDKVVWLARDISEYKQLEKQVRQSLARREQQVRVATQIAQETATAVDVEDLYRKAVAQIKEQFNFYHVELFQHEAETNMLSLAAGYGEVGRQMQFDGYQIPIGRGVVGLAAAIGAPLRRSHLNGDAARQPKAPQLPNSKDELAIPIQFGHFNTDAQLAALKGFIDSQVDGIIVFSVDPKPVAPLAKAAVDNGITVVAQTVDLSEQNQTALVGLDDYKAGYLLGKQAGDWAITHLPKDHQLKVAIFNYPSLPQFVEREQGTVDGIEARLGSNFEVTAREAVLDPASATSIAQSWLQTYPDLDMILGINDAGGLGGYRALVESDKNKADRFFVGGIDATDEGLNALAEGKAFQATVGQSPAKVAKVAVRTMVAAITNRSYETKTTLEPMIVTRQNLETFLADQLADPLNEDDAQFYRDGAGLTVGLSVVDRQDPFFADLIEAVEVEVERLGGVVIVNEPKPVLGVLNLHLDEPEMVDAEDQLVLEGLCGQIAVAVEKTRLIQEANIFRQFAETSGQGWCLITLEGQTAYVNPALAAMLDKNPADLVDQPLAELYIGEQRERLENEVLPAVWREGQWSGESKVGPVHGQTAPTLENYFLLKDNNNIPIFIAASITDITDHKQAELTLTKQAIELEARLQELNALQQLMSREGWRAYLSAQERSVQGYLFDQDSIKPVFAERSDLHLELPFAEPVDEAGQTVTRPISLAGESIGELGVYNDNPDNPLSADDQELLNLVAEQVAEAMERARLLEQTQKRAGELETVAQVGTIVSTTLEVESLLQTVVDLTKSSFNLYHAHVYLLDESQQNLILTAGAGDVGRQLVGEGWNISRDKEHSLVALAVRTREGVVANDVQAEPDFLANPLLPDTRSELAVPLIVGDKVLGVLDVQSDRLNHFTETDVRIQLTLANQIAVALENARLFEQQRTTAAKLEEQAHRLAVLNELSAELAATQTLDDIFSVAAIKAREIIDCDSVTIATLTETSDAVQFVGLEDDKLIELMTCPIEETAVGQVIKTNRLENYADLGDLEWQDTNQLLKQGFTSALVMPLLTTDGVIGTFNVANKIDHPFSQSDESLTRQLGVILSSVIDSRRLVEEMRQALAEVESVQRRYTVQAWEAYRKKQQVYGYQKVGEQIVPISGDESLVETSSSATVPEAEDSDAVATMEESTNSEATSTAQANLVVPLTVRNETIGVLGLEETDRAAPWSPEEIALVEIIAEQIAQAAENIRLLDETQTRAAREKRVNEISEKIQAAQSLDEALQIAAREVGLSLEAPQTVAKLDMES